MTVQDTKINLCDSCRYDYPECAASVVCFGDGIGHDNICCCNVYLPQTENGILTRGDTEDDG